MKKLLPEDTGFEAGDTLELIRMFAGTWFSLDAYDKSSFPTSGVSKKQVEFTAEELAEALTALTLLIAESHPGEKEFEMSFRIGNFFPSKFDSTP